MILGNRTETPRAVFAGKGYVMVPPMGVVTIDDVCKADLLAAIQPQVDAGIFVINEQINPNERPVEVASPEPPVELKAEPDNPKVKTKKPRKTGETMKV